MEIKEIREKYGISQAKLSKMVGISEWTIKRWEQGKRECLPYIANLIDFYLAHTIGESQEKEGE